MQLALRDLEKPRAIADTSVDRFTAVESSAEAVPTRASQATRPQPGDTDL